jgi:hypothetical protein
MYVAPRARLFLSKFDQEYLSREKKMQLIKLYAVKVDSAFYKLTVSVPLSGSFFVCGFCDFWATLPWKSNLTFLYEGPGVL